MKPVLSAAVAAASAKTFRCHASALALALAAAAPMISYAAVPPIDAAGRPATIRCGTVGGALVNAAHADKIIFLLVGAPNALTALVQADQPALNAIPRNTELDIKVLDNPRTVADLKGKVLSFLGAVDNPAGRAAIAIKDVDYAMVCPTTAAP